MTDRNAWFWFIRSAKGAAVAFIEAGHDPAFARATVLRLAQPALPDGDPLRAWTGSLLTCAIDDAIYRAVRQAREAGLSGEGEDHARLGIPSDHP